VDRQYEQLLFTDVFPEQGPVPLRHVGNIPHRVMAFEIATFEQRFREKRHPLLNFFFNTHHPDIDVGSATPPALARTQVREQVKHVAMQSKMTDLTLQTREFAFA
jgi:hypothetical protein